MNVDILNQQLKDIDSKFRYIAMGGCGAFALMLSERLEKLGYTTKIAFISDTYTVDGCIKKRQKYLNSNLDVSSIIELNERHISFHHVMVYYNGYLIDNRGVAKKFDETYFGNRYGSCLWGFMCKEALKRMVEAEGWNESFDREQLPDIKKEIQKLTV